MRLGWELEAMFLYLKGGLVKYGKTNFLTFLRYYDH